MGARTGEGRVFRSRVRNQLLLVMGLAAGLPLMALGLYSFVQLNDTTAQTISAVENSIQQDLLRVQEVELQNRASLINDRLVAVASELDLIRAQAQLVYQEPERFPTGGGLPLLFRDSKTGAAWASLESGASLFLSNRSAGASGGLERAGYLEPLMLKLTNHHPEVSASYVLLRETAVRMVPGVDFGRLVKAGLIPADMDASQYSFYFVADRERNPSRTVVWTDPYLDMTPRGWIVTATAPIDLADGQMHGVVAADVRITDIATRYLDLPFPWNDAFALMINRNGRLVSAAGPAREMLTPFVPDDPSNPTPNLLLTSSPELRTLVAQMDSGEGGVDLLTLGERKWYVLHTPIPLAHWQLAYFIPARDLVLDAQREAEESLSNSRQRLLIGYIGGTLVIGVAMVTLVVWLSRLFTSPISQLTDAVLALQKGEPVAVTAGRDDELGTLTRAFNQMAQTLWAKQAALADANAALSDWNRRLEQEVTQRTHELRQLYDESRAGDQARRNLMARVSHELRSPVTAIVGYVEALVDGIAQTEAERKAHLAIIAEKAEAMSRMIDDLFLLARLETGKLPMAFEHLPGTGVLATCLNQVRMDVERAGRRLEGDLPDNLPDLKVDPQRISQVVDNLVRNAIRYSPPGGTIRVQARQEGDLVLVSVEDQGCGIAPGDLPHLFEEFYRGGQQPGGGGAGLGLAIAGEIVAAHGGRIQVESRLGMGSRFTFSMQQWGEGGTQ